MNLLVLPNQLFDPKYLDKAHNIIIWECPHYFKDYNYNKKKLMLHRASMKCYYDTLKSHGFKVTYYEFIDVLDSHVHYHLFNPLNKPEILKLPQHHTIIDTPNMLLSLSLIDEYRRKSDKFFFNAFYMFGKKEINILPDIKSTDKNNRKSLPKNITIPHLVSTYDTALLYAVAPTVSE